MKLEFSQAFKHRRSSTNAGFFKITYSENEGFFIRRVDFIESSVKNELNYKNLYGEDVKNYLNNIPDNAVEEITDEEFERLNETFRKINVDFMKENFLITNPTK